MRLAIGEFVHPTVPSLLEQFKQPGIVGVPIRDLPPSETALVWLTARESGKIRAFAQAAADVMRSYETPDGKGAGRAPRVKA